MTGCSRIHTLRGDQFCAAAAFFQDFLTFRFNFLLADLSLSLSPEARCPVVFPGGSTFSITSCSVYLCTLSSFLAGRLVIQSNSRAAMLRISPVLKESLLHVAPCVFSDWVCTYQHGTFSFPIIFPPSLSLYPPFLSS